MSLNEVFKFSAIALTTATSAIALTGVFGNTPHPSLNTLKAGTGLANTVAASGAFKDSITDPTRQFYKLLDSVPLTSPTPTLAGLSPQQNATLLYGSFNTGLINGKQPTAENWDASAPLGDDVFAKKFLEIAVSPEARFQIVDSSRRPDKGGLGAVAYRDTQTDAIHIFVVGLETDVPQRDALPDLKSLLYGGMKEQTAELNAFVKDLNARFPNKIQSITGQSMGTIPASVVAFNNRETIPSIQLIVVEPRMNRDLAATFTDKPDEMIQWYQQNATAMEVGANAWSRSRVITLGEAPAVNAKNSLIITQDGKPLFGAPVVGMGIVGSPHQASRSVKNIALGTEGIGVSTVDSSTLPTNAAEVLRARGGFDIAGAAITGFSCLALTSSFAVGAALMVAQQIKNKMQKG
jgi:hypothetical protein